jgi:hypothetical protein
MSHGVAALICNLLEISAICCNGMQHENINLVSDFAPKYLISFGSGGALPPFPTTPKHTLSHPLVRIAAQIRKTSRRNRRAIEMMAAQAECSYRTI